MYKPYNVLVKYSEHHCIKIKSAYGGTTSLAFCDFSTCNVCIVKNYCQEMVGDNFATVTQKDYSKFKQEYPERVI